MNDFTGIRWLPRRFDLAEITVPETRRAVDEKAVASLQQSIERIGLLQPVAVYVTYDGEDNEIPVLCWGRHRLEALRRINPSQVIQCYDVSALSPAERRIAECDENLERADLTPEQRKQFIRTRLSAVKAQKTEAAKAAERKVKVKEAVKRSRDKEKGVIIVWSRDQTMITPKRGRPAGKSETTIAEEETAKALGVSVSTVKRAVREPMEPKTEQAVLLDLARLRSAWKAASPEARREFFAEIALERAAGEAKAVTGK